MKPTAAVTSAMVPSRWFFCFGAGGVTGAAGRESDML
jgi:hypothetical protein